MGESPTLRQLGEFAVIDRLVRGRRQPVEVAVGPGDDAAVVAAGDGRAVVSTDVLVQDRHFRLDWSTPHDVGRKAIAQNAADIEAMGGRAVAFVAGFGAPGETPTAQVDELVDGLWEEAQRLGAGIVGGDLVSCPQWVLSVTVLGDLDGRAPVLRSGPRPDQRLRWPGTWVARPPDTPCGTTILRASTSYAGAIWCRGRPMGRARWRRSPGPRR